MSDRILFTVIVPTHLRASLLFRALKSIKQQDLFQVHPARSVQVIVVSDVIDVATDSVCSQVLEYHDTYLRRSGQAGPAQSRNAALQLAAGQFILFLDDDDALQPGWLMAVLNAKALFDGSPVYGNCTVITERRLPQGTELVGAEGVNYAGRLNVWLHLKNQVHMSCYVFPRQCIGQRRFDPFMRAYEDWEFLLGLYRDFPARHVDEMASYVFEVDDETTDRRGSSEMASGTDALLDYLYVYRRYPSLTDEVRRKRAELLAQNGLEIPSVFL
jgi:glycosyltransferase involved in cell wall biosynthesis